MHTYTQIKWYYALHIYDIVNANFFFVDQNIEMFRKQKSNFRFAFIRQTLALFVSD